MRREGTGLGHAVVAGAPPAADLRSGRVAQGGKPNYQFLNWSRGVPQTNAGDLKMVTEWSQARLRRAQSVPDAENRSTQPSPDNKYISVERTAGGVMSDNPFVGTWTYRSLLNDPDVNKDFNKLEFGRGTIVIAEADSRAPHRHDRRTRLVADAARLARLRLADAGALSGQGSRGRRGMDLRLHRLAGAGLAEQRRSAAATRRSSARSCAPCRIPQAAARRRPASSPRSTPSVRPERPPPDARMMSSSSAAVRLAAPPRFPCGPQAPALAVGLIEASAYDRPRPGEVLPGLARVFLEHLGIWAAFQGRATACAQHVVSLGAALLARESRHIFPARSGLAPRPPAF